ncbi:MAG: caspase family protein [Acidobacteria bacterium]|nr:caspase family protein [Acidobacteriota bacterium]MCA1627056.1 caspase family protein [Acidobacteriota bacterium]
MAKGFSINIGLNSVDPAHYNGWDGALAACEFDAHDMYDIAGTRNFNTRHLLLTRDATSDAVVGLITEAANTLEGGDILLLTFSGHGSQVPNLNDDGETDGLDETWLLYDRELLDDELYALWARFKPGTRVFMLSDSCHSGSVSRQIEYGALLAPGSRSRGILEGAVARRFTRHDSLDEFTGVSAAFVDPTIKLRTPPAAVRVNTYLRNKEMYDRIQMAHPAGDKANVQASVLLISGCQDNQLSLDGFRNGLFTGTLREVWANGTFGGGYKDFHRDIRSLMPSTQTPNFSIVGADNPAFGNQNPFTV